MAETFQEYLVKLGWNVDKQSFSSATSFIKSFASTVNNINKNIIGSVVSASSETYGIFKDIFTNLIKFTNGVAQADNATAEFARKMWTTKENALSFNTALNALGKSMDDVFTMTPEEFQYLTELRNLGKNIQPPKELYNMLKTVRQINNEFNKLKVMFSYGKQWVTYYFLKYMGTDLETIRNKFAKLNEWLMQNLPKIASFIAKIFYTIYRYGKVIFNVIESVVKSLKDLWDSMDAGQRGLVKFGAGFLALLKMGPIGLFIAAILFIIELLDDIQTWKRGGKSLFGDVYDSVFGGENKKFSGIAGTIQRFVELKDLVLEILDHIKKIGANLGLWGDDVDGVTIAAEGLKAALDILYAACRVILEIINFIVSGIQAITGGVYDLAKDNPWRINDENQYNYLRTMSGYQMPTYQEFLAMQGVGGGGNTTNNNSMTISPNIEVNEAQSAAATGDAVAQAMINLRNQYGAFF